MGNKIRELAEIEMGDKKYSIELNGGTKEELYDIHIQNENINIKLDPEEHVEYKWIKNLADLDGESIVPYLYDIMK